MSRYGIRRRGLEAVWVGAVASAGGPVSSLYLVPELAGALRGIFAALAFLLPRLGGGCAAL